MILEAERPWSCSRCRVLRWVISIGTKSYIRYNSEANLPAAIPLGRPTDLRLYPMVSNNAKEIFIWGITLDGKPFRPSDWAERLAGVMSPFRPGGATPGSHLSYSPWCTPKTLAGVKCVIVNRELREHNVMAFLPLKSCLDGSSC